MCFLNVWLVIDRIIWLEETLSYFGVEGVDVESFDVDNGRLVQSRIVFFFAARRDRGVVQILEVGVKAPEKKIAIKYVVKSCLNKLVNIGYTLPTLSSMTIQAIDVGSYIDVAGFCARIARTNRNDVVKSKSNS